MSDLYEIEDNNFNYYHYQPGSNIMIVYFKHITHAHTRAHACATTHAHAHRRPDLPEVLDVFRVLKKLLGRTETRERVTGCVFRRYEQLETSPETIEQELRPAVCEHR